MTSALATNEEHEQSAADPTDPEQGVPRQSGIPPRKRYSLEQSSCADANEHLELAIVESAHAEVSLSMLSRGLHSLLAGVTAATDANLTLGRELETVRELLAHTRAERAALVHRVRLLEDALECARRDAQREWALFLEQEDAFLGELLSDHASEIAALERRLYALARPPSPPVSSGVTLDAVASETAPSEPAAETSSEETAAAMHGNVIGSVKLRTVRVPSSERPIEPAVEASAPVAQAPRPALTPQSWLWQKPDPSTRPLVEYSLDSSQITEDEPPPDNS